MGCPRIQAFLLLLFVQVSFISAATNPYDLSMLTSLESSWENAPPSWVGVDPCGSKWEGVGCTNSRVTSLTLSSNGLKGVLSGDISELTELQILDLSNNKELKGPIPSSIGNLKKLTNLILLGCSFSGPIPDSIGSLERLIFLSLNSNGFTGRIPPSIGKLSNLHWLDLADNQLSGPIPVSSGSTPGLDLLVGTKHFHLGKNKLSGPIPNKLFSSNMTLIHVLFDSNELTGPLPSSLGLVQTLEVVRFDRNKLTGPVPENINNLIGVSELILSNAGLTGPLPNFAGMSSLTYLDISNNSFDASGFPSWHSTSQALTTLMMDNTGITGNIPSDLFRLPHLQTVTLRNNQLNETLDIGPSFSDTLQFVDLQNNKIEDFKQRPGRDQVIIILVDNPVCQESEETESYCSITQPNTFYATPPRNCVPQVCSLKQISSPTCQCSYPFTGLLEFRAPSFSDLGNKLNFAQLENKLMYTLTSHQLPVDSVSLSNPTKDESEYLDLNLEIFPAGDVRFNRTTISAVGFALSNQTFKPPRGFGPFVFKGDSYPYFPGTGSNKSSSTPVIIGAAAGGTILLLLLILSGVYAHRQKKRAQRATRQNNPFAHWESSKSSIAPPQLKGARSFTFDELRKYTNNFSDANDIGSGGYGKVYRGTLPTGQLIAIKRAQQESMQGGLEFKTEIELLSRVHHKNLVSLLGFCFERGEQMLIYEFVPNGSLRDSLSGKTGIKVDWIRRLKMALGAARGLAYLHELANPPIIHRDVKSSNVLLDERLNAKVGDFGLSKLMSDTEKGHISTQVKGTAGYLDPEYYMTQQLTEKSDVYSFGVLMLEIATGRKPIERQKYIVREVRMALDRTKEFYNLYELLDPSITDATLKGLDKFIDLALKCVQESGVDRPAMSEVVKEIESILQHAGVQNAESASASERYEDASKGKHPYGKDAFDYSGGFSPLRVEPQ